MEDDSNVIELSAEIDASPETVWQILTGPELFSAWMQGEVTFEPRRGSAFRAAFPNFNIVIAGEIVALDAEARHLQLTWGTESGPQADTYAAGSSLLEFRVNPSGSGCRVDLRHRGLPSAEAAKQQEGGWNFQLSRLNLEANRIDLGAGLERTLPDWIAAWNDQDAETRLAALRRCCADDITFRDDWTGLTGIELLSMHIASCHQYMPGYSLEHTGDVRVCRGEALVGWRATGPGGGSDGFNHIQADPDGTIRQVTVFQKG